MPSASSCRSCWVSIFCEMPGIARSRSEKRRTPWLSASVKAPSSSTRDVSTEAERPSHAGGPRLPQSTATQCAARGRSLGGGRYRDCAGHRRLPRQSRGTAVPFHARGCLNREVGDHDMSFDLGLSGRRALVTAGTKGVGASVIEVLRENGAKLVTSARSTPRSPLAGVHYVAANIMTAEGCALVAHSALNHLGGIDIVVNVLGGSEAPAGGFAALDDEAWRNEID